MSCSVDNKAGHRGTSSLFGYLSYYIMSTQRHDIITYVLSGHARKRGTAAWPKQ